MRGLAIAGTALVALLAATPATATTTIGQLAPAGATSQNCGPSSGGYVQQTVTSGRSYAVPANGVRITSWSTAAHPMTAGQQMALRVLRPLGGASFQGVTHDGPRSLTPSSVNTFQVNLAVKPGDVLSLDSGGSNFPAACGFLVSGENGEYNSFPNPPPADGASETFFAATGAKVNVTAEVEVTNAFSFGAMTRNKKKGRGTAIVHAAGPGSFALSGRGLKAQQAPLGNTVGDVILQVIPKGKVKKKLRQRGKARVTVSVTYTPDGGAAGTQSLKLKLLKKT
jgi:hypothetical protein